MKITHNVPAKRYAHAIFNLCKATFSLGDIEVLRHVADFLNSHHQLSLALNTQTTSTPIIQQVTEIITHHFKLSSLSSQLMASLIRTSRIALLPDIIRHLEQLYNHKHNRFVCNVSSSHPLQDKQKESILKFIKRSTNAAEVHATFSVDPSLISGIRMRSTDLLWERSIRKTFIHIKQGLIMRA